MLKFEQTFDAQKESLPYTQMSKPPQALLKSTMLFYSRCTSLDGCATPWGRLHMELDGRLSKSALSWSLSPCYTLVLIHLPKASSHQVITSNFSVMYVTLHIWNVNTMVLFLHYVQLWTVEWQVWKWGHHRCHNDDDSEQWDSHILSSQQQSIGLNNRYSGTPLSDPHLCQCASKYGTMMLPTDTAQALPLPQYTSTTFQLTSWYSPAYWHVWLPFLQSLPTNAARETLHKWTEVNVDHATLWSGNKSPIGSALPG